MALDRFFTATTAPGSQHHHDSGVCAHLCMALGASGTCHLSAGQSCAPRNIQPDGFLKLLLCDHTNASGRCYLDCLRVPGDSCHHVGCHPGRNAERSPDHGGHRRILSAYSLSSSPQVAKWTGWGPARLSLVASVSRRWVSIPGIFPERSPRN